MKKFISIYIDINTISLRGLYCLTPATVYPNRNKTMTTSSSKPIAVKEFLC